MFADGCYSYASLNVKIGLSSTFHRNCDSVVYERAEDHRNDSPSWKTIFEHSNN